MSQTTGRIVFLAGLLDGYCRTARAGGATSVTLACADVEELIAAAAKANGVTLAKDVHQERAPAPMAGIY